MKLGKTNLRLKPLGVGAWAWGDRYYWGYGRQGYGENEVYEAFLASVESGLTFFDTAEIYGTGRSEKLLGEFIRRSETQDQILVATKFFPYPWRILKSGLHSALLGSLARLEIPAVHLYQIHWPYRPRSIETWVSALAGSVKKGLAQAVGVSNYNLSQMRQAQAILESEGLSLASNQVEFSLIARSAEYSGLLKACRDSGISLIAYSPIGSGVLTGKYSPEQPPPGPRGRRYTPAFLGKIQPLLQLMRDLGTHHGGKTPTQVALNWVIQKGAIPIPGAKTRAQALENAGALGWELSVEEIAALDRASGEIN